MLRFLTDNASAAPIDVLLIQPPIRDFYLTAKRSIPYGLTSIAAQLTAAGFKVALFDALATRKSRRLDPPAEMRYLQKYFRGPDRSPFALWHQYRHYGYSFESIGRTARAARPFLVGISCLFTAYVNEALRTAEVVKAYLPDCRVVLGGHHPTVLPESAMVSGAVDFVLRGEGEVAMVALAQAISQNRPFENLPGLVRRSPKGRLRLHAPVFVGDPEDFPLPAVELTHPTYYRRNQRDSVVITASRGCPMNCSYCSVGDNSFTPYRRRSVDAVIEEIGRAAELRNIGFIDFEDENLSLDRRWFQRLLEAIEAHFGSQALELRAMNGLFPPTLDEPLLRKMRSAGFRTVNLSLATISPEQLRRFRRPDVRWDFEHLLRICERLNLEAVGYIIVGAPFQPPQVSIEDLLFLASRRVLAGVSVFYPAPGSRDYSRCEALGILPRQWSLMRSTALPLSHTTRRKETVTLLRLGRIINFMKQLADRKYDPPTEAAVGRGDGARLERLRAGVGLLKNFLSDGKIRGIDDSGRVFEHLVAPRLTKAFLSGLQRIDVHGVRERR
jgi:radical SAM superfamily enzyme YgiQ (UPF0313 family)